MRRRRELPADPVRSTRETVDLIGELIAGTLPGADAAGIDAAVEALRPLAGYLVPGEHLTRSPLTLVAGSLACDLHTLHGEDAEAASDPTPPPGATGETDWELFVPVPAGAPFSDADVEAADEHLRPGAAPASAGTTAATEAVSLSDLVDLASLRSASDL